VTPRMQVIVVAAILALAGAVDFVQRIHVPRSLAIRGAGMEATALPDLPLSLASARQRLQSWLPTQTSGPQASPGIPCCGCRTGRILVDGVLCCAACSTQDRSSRFSM